MLITPRVAFTYDCRQCCSPIFGTAELFILRTRRYICRCDCGASPLTATLRGNALLIEYPCSICGKRHRESVPVGQILRAGTVPLRCPSIGIAACYVGTPEAIAYMDSAESERTLTDFIRAQLGLPQEEVSHTDAILAAVRTLADAGMIRCLCGALQFHVVYEEGVLTISCRTCGKEKSFPMQNAGDIHRMLKNGEIKLE